MSNSPIDPSAGVQVAVENSGGQVITTNTDSITMSVGTNAGIGNLSGSVTVAAVSGVATFTKLSINNAQNGYTLVAVDNTNSSVSSAVSAAFNETVIPAFSTLRSFGNGSQGYNPDGGLVRDTAGNCYGTTSGGGLYNDGTVFELSGTNNSVYTTLISFTGTSGPFPGASPSAGLTLDSSGDLFGTTSAGGTAGDGTVFELSGTKHKTFSSLVSFTGTSGIAPGSGPVAAVTLDASGNIYGTTPSGGGSGYGTVFMLAGAKRTYSTLVSFTGNTGAYLGSSPDDSLTFDSSGNLYGTTQTGGSGQDGTVFELSGSAHTTFRSVISFSPSLSDNPADPYGSVIFDSSGNLYGTTGVGGATAHGDVFELSGATHTTYTALVSFTGSSGAAPGTDPDGGLTFDTHGNLYGTTTAGGANGDGTVFELSGSTHQTFASLITFTGASGSVPGAGPSALAIDANGNLYGTTASSGTQAGTYGGGTCFTIPASNLNSLTTLMSFGPVGGRSTDANLIEDASGNLYGTTNFGGADGTGTVYELSGPGYSTITTLVAFTGSTGSAPGDDPQAGLVADTNGDLFGTTFYGTATNGTVFELSGTNHQTFHQLVSFTGTTGTDPGKNPDSNLVIDSSGNLYGTTYAGGAMNDGVVFEIPAPSYSTFVPLISFTGSSGAYPGANPNGLAIDSHGNLFGTTYMGGANGVGSLFELSGASHTTFATLVSFTGYGGADPGAYPESGVTIDASGDLFGTTTTGGSNGDGNVFEYSSSGVYTSLVSFTGYTGNQLGSGPEAAPILGSNGILYGTTVSGGAGVNIGTVYQLSGTAHTTFATVCLFTYTTGPYAGDFVDTGLTLDSYGNLFGTTSAGAAYSAGSVYEIAAGAVNNLVVSTGSETIAAQPGDGSEPGEYFSSVSIGNGASLSTTAVPASPNVLQTNSLTIAGTTGAWTGTLDLTDDDLDIATASLATVTNQLAWGFKSGKWNGTGIISSTAASDSTHLTALGVIQNNQSGTALFTSTNTMEGVTPGAGDILVKYTYYGDANLSGTVDSADYTLIDAGYLSHGTRTGWYNGDFNYDGVINGSDYTLIDNAFNTQGASLAAQIAKAKPEAVFAQSQIAVTAADATGGGFAAPSNVAVGIFGGDDSDQQLKQKKRIQF